MKNFILKGILFFVFALQAFPYSAIAVPSVIERNYSYKEWRPDEERMLRVMLTSAHHDVGMPLSEDEQFTVDHPILRAQIIKEMFYTEDFSNRLGTFMIQLYLYDLTYAYTSREIIDMMSENVHKLETSELNDSSERVARVMLKMILSYGLPEDIPIIERIEKVLPPKYIQRISKYKRSIKSRTKESDRRFTGWEQKLNSKNNKALKGSNQLQENGKQSAMQLTPFILWLVGILLVIVIILFILRAKSKQ